MRKTLCMIMIVAALFGCTISAFASNNAVVYSEKAVTEKDTLCLVPVKIRGNKGIMGFRFTVKSTAKNVKIVSVKRGEVTKSGNFNTSLGIKEDEFDVLWNTTEDIKDDGTLFVLGIKADAYFDDQALELSYNKEDTFNEQWDEVPLTCEKIRISCAHSAPEHEETVGDDKPGTTVESAALTDGQIVDGVQLTLDQMGEASLADIKPEDREKFVESLNKNLSAIIGSDQKVYTGFQDACLDYNSSYKSYFIDGVTGSISKESIKSVIEHALESSGHKTIDELNEGNGKTFLKNVEKDLRKLDPDLPSISNDVDVKTALSAVKKLYGGLALIDTDESETSAESSKPQKIWWIVAVGAFVLAIVILLYIRKVKKPKGEKT